MIVTVSVHFSQSRRGRSFMMVSNAEGAMILGHLGYSLPEQNRALNHGLSIRADDLRARLSRARRLPAVIARYMTTLRVVSEPMLAEQRVYLK
jgi:C4-dicarboxylate-specific signal transduction histidine kinase